MTHTYAVLEVSQAVYDEIRARLVEAHYEHTFHRGDGEHPEVIDMHGIALAPLREDNPSSPASDGAPAAARVGAR
jgi:hypothetical protein